VAFFFFKKQLLFIVRLYLTLKGTDCRLKAVIFRSLKTERFETFRWVMGITQGKYPSISKNRGFTMGSKLRNAIRILRGEIEERHGKIVKKILDSETDPERIKKLAASYSNILEQIRKMSKDDLLRMDKSWIPKLADKDLSFSEYANSIILKMDRRGNITFFNDFAQKFFGFSREEIWGENVVGNIVPEKDSSGQDLEKVILDIGNDPHKYVNHENENVTKEGERKWISWTNQAFYNGNNEIVEILCIGNDITDRKQIERELLRKKEEQDLLLESVPAQLWYLTDMYTYGAVNQAHASFFNLSKRDIEYQPLQVSHWPEDAYTCQESNRRVFETGSVFHAQEWLHNGNNEPRLLDVTKVPKVDDEGNIKYIVCSAFDVTERHQMEERLRDMSIYDSLSGLYNRSFFEKEMERLNNNKCFPLGIIVCDINGLKLMNDTAGHEKGDELIKTLSDILKESFRSEDIICRTGGDEFVILMPLVDKREVKECCKKIRQTVRECNINDQKFGLSVSLGYAMKEDGDLDVYTLFKRADNAMYKEKLQQSHSSRSEIVQTLIKTMEARDFVTDGHTARVQHYAYELGKILGLSEERLNDLSLLSRFHDLGKVGIPDHILFKNGKLNKSEFEEIKKHSEIGYRIAISASDLAHIADFILKHHEWWNGKGYPLGCYGEKIPLESRIITIVDAYDAMISDRPYKEAMSHEEAIEELRNCSGTQFDAELVKKFISMIERLK
jgi:diguanylate cyclase (GGDEF)-like protein/PAS domain S-box-containing protein